MSNETSSDRKPSHRLYAVMGEGKDAVWVPVGAAWPHRNSNGFGISMYAVPLQGRLVMMTEKPKGDPAAELRG